MRIIRYPAHLVEKIQSRRPALRSGCTEQLPRLQDGYARWPMSSVWVFLFWNTAIINSRLERLLSGINKVDVGQSIETRCQVECTIDWLSSGPAGRRIRPHESRYHSPSSPNQTQHRYSITGSSNIYRRWYSTLGWHDCQCNSTIFITRSFSTPSSAVQQKGFTAVAIKVPTKFQPWWND